MKLFRNTIITLTCALAAVTCLSASAQETSPYSKFGYGLMGDNATSAQRQMGSTGYAMHSGRQINVMNPASYASVDSMTFLFDMGVDVSLYWRQDNSGKQRDWGGGIDYITMLFPVSKTVGVSAGLVPFSSVGYSFGSTLDNGTTSHQGSGGINQLYLGAGWMPLKGLSIGFNVSYLFGNTYNTLYATHTGGTGAVFEQTMEIQDYRLRFGAQYTCNLSSKNSVTLGVSYEPGKSVLGKTYVVKYLQSNSASPDTIAPGVVKMRDLFSYAPSYGVGLAWDWNERVHAEVDFTYQPWKNAKYAQIKNFSATRLDNRWKIGVGASYMPDPRGSYLKRVTYRAGVFYNRDYIMAGDNNVNDYGISCGLGLPTSSSRTIVNIGFDYRQRQSSPVALLKEKYFNITLGVNFNGNWFYHNKLR